MHIIPLAINSLWDTHTHTHTCTHAHTDTHTHTLTLRLPSTPTLHGRYLPSQPREAEYKLTSFEFRPSRRTPRRVDGSRTIAGTWVKRPGAGASTTSCIVWCVCMMNPHCWLARPTRGNPDPTWSPPQGHRQECCHYLHHKTSRWCVTMSATRRLAAHTLIHTHIHT